LLAAITTTGTAKHHLKENIVLETLPVYLASKTHAKQRF
jgi:hypothetical protein